MAFFTQHSDEQYAQVVQERDAALKSLQVETEAKNAEAAKVQAEAAKTKVESDKRVALEKQVADLQAKLTAETNAKNAEAAKVQAEAAKVVAEVAKTKAESDKRVALEKQIADLQAKLTAETNAKNAEAAKVQAETAKTKDLQEENDLLLAQLHQVQEELERYYLKNKDLESSVGDVTASLRNARYLLINSKLAAKMSKQKLLPRS